MLILRRTLLVLIPIVLILAGLWVFGPREPARLEPQFSAAAIGDDPASYLARTEADVPNLRSNAEKEIVWAYPLSKAKTPIALVYVHGFSAAKGELRPLVDDVAKKIGANLFYTRLSGHGRNGAAMGEATVGDWVDDMAEAMAIGRRIGERVVVIGSSTGATLATLAASRPDLSQDMAGLVALSPNYGLQNWRSFALTLPFARKLLPYLQDETYSYTPLNDAFTANWTVSYPTSALLPMARLVEVVRGLDMSAIHVPALFITSPNDVLVDPEKTAEIAAHWGAPHEEISVTDDGDPEHHLLAGDIVSPATTARLADQIAQWIETLPAR
ncbi:alpha/beta hydrolase [Aureimonas ureilytica]|uniref:alpha/beta hydrolase n=1 Tax=Aureimonas ureilytica TaxID=401562 RepID=UPI000AB75E4E|nr:alpha/beta fold hydrolase [Aureimonas ureilytica]